MINNSFFKNIFLLFSVIFLTSCDKEFNEIGGDLIGENNFDLSKQTYSVSGYTQKTNAVQSNNLAVNPLGIYSDVNFGQTIANFNTQLTLSSVVTSVGANPFVESVILTVPYFVDSDQTKLNTDGTRTYVLDSIYGPDKAKMKLSVYESGFFMRDLDPATAFKERQKYYSNQNADFDALKLPTLLNDSSDKSQNEEFFFNPAERAVVTTDTVTNAKTTTYSAPAMELALNKAYFKTKIIDAINSGKLASNEVFKNYFRGLYFKIEKLPGSAGNMAMLNYSEAKITIKYNEDGPIPAGATKAPRVKKTIELDLQGNSVSLLNNDFTAAGMAYNSLPFTGNTAAGDDKLFLRGGDGAVSVLELFDKTDLKGYDANGVLGGPNGISDELDDLRNPSDGKKLLVNEANLVFHIDAASMASSKEPQRIYVYDYTNNRALVDFALDPTTNAAFPKKGKTILDGRIRVDATSKRGTTYKVRITNQIRNLINNKDSTNVRLGVVVTEDINVPDSYSVRNSSSAIKQVPIASVMNPLGTILYGGKATVPADKRLKLEIYFTKPN